MKILLVVLIAVLCFTTYRSDDMNIEKKHAQMLYVTVGIKTDKNTGSGVVIYSGTGTTIILTAKHVINKAKKITVDLYPSETEHTAVVVSRSSKYDLALISIEGNVPYVAKVFKGDTLPVYRPVWKVGAGAGLIPHPSQGIVTIYKADTMFINTNITFGDSGGPVFVENKGKYELVGIISAVATLNRFSHIYHLGIAVNPHAISRFIYPQ